MSKLRIKLTQVIALVVAILFCGSSGAQTAEPDSKLTRLNQVATQKFVTLAKLKVAIWRPDAAKGPSPLVIFSHGFHGRNTQSNFLMVAMAKAGYLVLAPDHDDATAFGAHSTTPPDVPFRLPAKWNDTTYKKRGQDIENLVAALHQSKEWNATIDWSKVALCGHSLGGYTVLGLAGAWQSWKMPGIKAVLALSPYCLPYTLRDTLGGIKIPVMYQGGTADVGITPSVKRDGGAYEKTNSPVYFVEFDKMNHMGWTGYNQSESSQRLVDSYSIAFLDKYVKGDKSVTLQDKQEGVSEFLAK